LKERTARRINIGFGVALGVFFLLSVLFGAVLYAPSFGYAVPGSLAWVTQIPLSEYLWIDSGISILFIAYVLFGLWERKHVRGSR
jgi:uncharacterized membrane protein